MPVPAWDVQEDPSRREPITIFSDVIFFFRSGFDYFFFFLLLFLPLYSRSPRFLNLS